MDPSPKFTLPCTANTPDFVRMQLVMDENGCPINGNHYEGDVGIASDQEYFRARTANQCIP